MIFDKDYRSKKCQIRKSNPQSRLRLYRLCFIQHFEEHQDPELALDSHGVQLDLLNDSFLYSPR